MVVRAVCFTLGSVFLFSFSVLPALWLCLVLAGVAVVAAFRFPPLSSFIAGFLLTAWHASTVVDARLPADWLHREITVVGVVAGLPEQDKNKHRFLLSLQQLCEADTDECVVVPNVLTRISWYRDAPPIAAGQRWRLNLKLRQPHGFMNPGGFDYEKWLFQQRVVATGYVRSSENAVLYASSPSLLSHGQRIRLWLRERLLLALDGSSHTGLILAIAIGDRSDIDRTQWQRFIATGTNHLLAISGLHISLIAALAALVAAMVWRRVVWLHRISRFSFVLFAGFLAALCYAALAGFAVPTQRALLMFGVVALLSVSARHQNRLNGLAFAMALICAINPLVVLSAGFWMSFSAVAILFIVHSFIPVVGRTRQLLAVIRGHALITVGLYPVGLVFFGHMSLISPLANFFAVPVVGLILTPMIFIASLMAVISVSLASVVLLPVNWLLTVVTSFLGWLSRWDYALKYVSVGDYPVALWSAGVALLLLLPVGWRLRWLAAVVALPLFLSASPRPSPGDYVVTFLDVGQGTSVVVRTHDHVLVYDTGDRFSESFNAADAVVLPYLRTNGINSVDRLMLSHADRDHSGGAPALLAGMQVEQTVAPAPINNVALSGFCRAGQQWMWDGVLFEVVHPHDTDAGSKNDRSCVVLITSADHTRTLLSGDIEAVGEAALLRRGMTSVDVLLAPHHGSSSSSGEAFVATTQPRFVVHSAGFQNRFGFPHHEVIEAYRAIEAMQYQTATSGAVTFTIDGGDIIVEEFRPSHRKLWHQAFAR